MDLRTTILATALIVASPATVGTAAPLAREFNMEMVASDVVQSRAPTQRIGQFVSKEFKVLYSGTVRVGWEYRSSGHDAGPAPVGSEVLIGREVYCSRGTLSTDFSSVSCDVTVPAGTVIAVQARRTGSRGRVVVRNATLSYDLVEMPRASEVLLD
jgi:hypothetical protein